MEQNLKDFEKITYKKVKENKFLKMVRNLKEITRMVKNKVTEFLHGLTEQNMMETGIKTNIFFLKFS